MRLLRRVRTALVLLGGCLLAAWLGEHAGRYFQFEDQDFRSAPPPHLYVSGRTYLQQAETPAPVEGAAARGT